jgi:hypothetical protein
MKVPPTTRGIDGYIAFEVWSPVPGIFVDGPNVGTN